MSRRLDVLYPLEYQDRDGKTQTKWYGCGSAFEDDQGRITLRIAMLPVAQAGELKFMLMAPKSNGPTQAAQNERAPAGGGYTGGGSGGGW